MADLVVIDGDSIAYVGGAMSSPELAKMTVDRVIGNILQDTGVRAYELFLEPWEIPKCTFRDSIATEREYKGNRKGPKPEFVTLMREYMRDTWNAQLAWPGLESEDCCVVRAYENGIENTIVAYVDKDLEGHPLQLYNYTKRIFLRPTEHAAKRWHAKQLLMGDSTDNIVGIKGMGPAGANKVLRDADDDTLLQTVAQAYRDGGYSYEYFIEMYNLITIRSVRETIPSLLIPMTEEEYNSISVEVM